MFSQYEKKNKEKEIMQFFFFLMERIGFAIFLTYSGSFGEL